MIKYLCLVGVMALTIVSFAVAREEAPPVPVESDAEACAVCGEGVSNRHAWRQARRDWRADRPRRPRRTRGGSAGSTGSNTGGSAGSTGSFSGGYGNVANRNFSNAKLPVLGLPVRVTAKVRQNRFERIDNRRGW